MGPENAFIAAQLSMLTKAIRDIGGGSEETPLRGYVTRFDRGESYFQEDGKGYLAVGSEINDPALYDTKAFPYEETMPHWEYEPVFGPGLVQPSTGYSPTMNWRWATCDDTNIAMGATDSISFSTNGVDFTTLYLTEAESSGWNAGNDKLKQVYDAVYHAGVLWVVASTHANSTARLLKLSADLKGFTEIPNSTILNRFKKTNGRVLCVGGSIAYDITNPEEPIRYTPGAFNDITYWSGKWWVATASGLKSGVDLAGTLDVVTAGAHYLVNGSVEGLMASIGTSILLTTDGTNWNPATGPEGLNIGATAGLLCSELNGKLTIRSTAAGSSNISAQQNVIIYDPKTNSWEELFTPDGMVTIMSSAMPLWYRGEYWVFGTLGSWNNYMRTKDLRVWSGKEVDAIASTFYTDETLRKNLLGTLRSGDKILRLHARNITYSLDGGVTYKTALGPQKSVGALTPLGLNVFVDNGEFFIFSFRGHWVSSDLENWTALPTTFLLDNTTGVAGRTITRLKPDMWVSHGAYSSNQDTYYSTDRGRSWTAVTLKSILGVYFDSTRNKYGAFVGGQVYVGTTLANLAVVNSQTTAVMSGIVNALYDGANDVVLYRQMGGPTLYNIDGATPHTSGQTYTYRPFNPDFTEWGYAPNTLTVMGDGIYARSSQVIRTGKNVGFLGYKYNHPARSWVAVEWLLPVDGWELPFSHRGGVYPYTQTTGAVYTVSYVGESVSKSGKPALAVGGCWFELDTATGAPTRLNDPRPAFATVAKVIRINPIYRSKVATDGKGTAAFVAHNTLFVSRNGGEFRPTLNGSIHNVQYAAGVWCLTAVHYSTKAQTADAVITALSVCMSLDLVTFKSYTFWSSSSGETYVDFLWCVGRWFPITISTLYGPTASSGQKMDTWLTTVTFRAGYITKGDELLQVGQPPVKSLPWNGMLHRAYGFVSGVEWASYSDGDYVNSYAGNDGDTTAWTSELRVVEYRQSNPPSGGNPDIVEYAFNYPSHTLLTTDKRAGQFLTVGPVVMPRAGSSINTIAGRGIGRYALLSGSMFDARGWVDWGKHRYVFARTNLGFTVVVGTQYYRVCKMWIAGNTGNYLSITTGDCGQIFILTARGSLLRGKRGIVATPVQSNNLSNIYMRVL